jgi:K+-transporting ATPase ATPase C chain
MLKQTMVALRVTLLTLILTGVIYPLAVTGLAQALFPDAANGSILNDNKGNAVGSSLIGQGFSSDAYFHSRPSAAGKGWDATSSGGSNLGPTSKALRDRVTGDIASNGKISFGAAGPIPEDLVTTSGSGLDPDITPEGAHWQVQRVAEVRHVSPARIRALVEGAVEGRSLGFLGEPHVNVLLLNLAVDRQFGKPEVLSPSSSAASTPSPAP